MSIKINPQTIDKIIIAPGSKSAGQRAVAIACLAEGTSELKFPTYCNDLIHAIQIAKDLGARIENDDSKIIISGTNSISVNEINCGESGLGIRMFSPIVSLSGNSITINGEGSLKTRPVDIISEALTKFGVSCTTNKGLVPLHISGKLKGTNAELDGSLSSQVLTGLLIALPLCSEDSEITVTNLKSKPYIDLTIEIMSKFNVEIENINYELFKIKGGQKYKATNYDIEGDWSGAAFLLVAGLIAGKIEVKNLNLTSKQADKEIIEAIKLAGGNITITKNSIITQKSELHAFKFDATDCPDLFPPLVSLASYCTGVSEIKGVSRLKHKESDRATVLKNEFEKIGLKIENIGDIMYIYGGKIKGGKIHSNNDHRIAMAGAVVALSAENPIEIENHESVNKSYPGFFNDLTN